MSIIWVVVGTIGQLMLGVMLFMLAVFGGGGMANGRSLDKIWISILDLAMFALPLSCLVAASMVIYLFRTGSGSWAYCWYAAPLGLAVLYFFFLNFLSRQ